MQDSNHNRCVYDYLIIGSGISGLFAALKAAKFGSVAVITKKQIADCNTMYAQGGIACVSDKKDTFGSHINDTIIAGAGLCKEDVVRSIIEDGPLRIRELIETGLHFTKRKEVDQSGHGTDAEFDLGKEGGHTHRRVLHCGDFTGREIIEILYEACRKNPAVKFYENFHAIDLIVSKKAGLNGPNRCLGAYVLDRGGNKVDTFLSKFTILATGGAGKVYLYTSNPDVACGEGIAMAYRAFAEISNMEFFQFHPTCLYHPSAKSFLISEAVRGEGGILKVRKGDKYVEFMEGYHRSGGLAPRDIVARAIDQELKQSGHSCAYLDIRHRDASFIIKRFPNIYKTCRHYGVDMTEDLIPVVPAAHYCCGGIKTDINGKTSVQNLYAAGEVGCTGLHGANRLASNSLLESLVVAHNAIKDSETVLNDVDAAHLTDKTATSIPDWSSGDAVDADELIVIYHNWDEIRRFMWDYVGIFRTTKRLERAKSRIRNIRKEIEHFYWDFKLSADLVELRNMASIAEMIIDSALAREHSVGLHYNADCKAPDPSVTLNDTVLRHPGFG